jgi:hypothetical protein
MRENPCSIWIEAEQWTEENRNEEDNNTGEIVNFDDGSKWIASFFTYQNIISLSEKNKKTGECLNGQYFWASNMVLVIQWLYPGFFLPAFSVGSIPDHRKNRTGSRKESARLKKTPNRGLFLIDDAVEFFIVIQIIVRFYLPILKCTCFDIQFFCRKEI